MDQFTKETVIDRDGNCENKSVYNLKGRMRKRETSKWSIAAATAITDIQMKNLPSTFALCRARCM